MLYNYPSKLKTYKTLSEKNKEIEKKEDKVKLNAYHSPSPMNELCNYICAWEKKNILWDNDVNNLVDARCLIINNEVDLSDRKTMRICRRYVNQYATEIKKHIILHREKADDENLKFNMDTIVAEYKKRIAEELQIDEELIANYVIKVSYSSISISKSFAWSAYGDYIIDNLKKGTSQKRNVTIQEVPYKTNGSYEYLGKYYKFEVGDSYIPM